MSRQLPWRSLAAIASLALLAIGLIPVFQANLTRPGDDYFFSQWDAHSQALVIGKIESETSGGSPIRFGLVSTAPSSDSAYEDFGSIGSGSPHAVTSYSAYASSIGLQGYAFAAAYELGCDSLTCLNTLESTLFSAVFVLFSTLLALAVRRGLGIAFLVTGVLSPWVVSAAHNLYWVPWTWLLPACAACFLVLATTRRQRIIAYTLVGAATALKSATGYEYLTSVALLASSMPMLAFVFRRRTTLRVALIRSAIVVGAAVAGFVVVLLVHAAIVGEGSIPAGLQWVMQDAGRRTYGGTTDADPLVTASLKASVFTVLGRYFFGWSTPILAFGTSGDGFSLAVPSQGFWLLLIIAMAVAIAMMFDRDQHERGLRYLLTVTIAVLPPVSWLVLAKSHAYAETNETYLLWYFMLVPAVVWVIWDAATVLVTQANRQPPRRQSQTRDETRHLSTWDSKRPLIEPAAIEAD